MWSWFIWNLNLKLWHRILSGVYFRCWRNVFPLWIWVCTIRSRGSSRTKTKPQAQEGKDLHHRAIWHICPWSGWLHSSSAQGKVSTIEYDFLMLKLIGISHCRSYLFLVFQVAWDATKFSNWSWRMWLIWVLIFKFQWEKPRTSPTDNVSLLIVHACRYCSQLGPIETVRGLEINYSGRILCGLIHSGEVYRSQYAIGWNIGSTEFNGGSGHDGRG